MRVCAPRRPRADKAKTVSLHSTQLSGSVPLQIAQLTRLSQLTLFGNKLSGSLPPQMASMKAHADKPYC